MLLTLTIKYINEHFNTSLLNFINVYEYGGKRIIQFNQIIAKYIFIIKI